jgi:hypothetical protein
LQNFEEVSREPLGEVRFGTKRWENKMEVRQALYGTLGWNIDFPKVCEEPLKSIRYLIGLFQDPYREL